MDDAPATLSRRGFIAGLAGSALALGTLRAGEPPLPVPDPVTPDSLPSLRRQFLLPDGLIYLNNGSLGPCPIVAMRAMQAAMEQLQTEPTGQAYGTLIERAEAARAAAAAFLGCQLAELAVASNTTEAMGWVAQGLRLRPGDRVLTTNHEHPGGSLCWTWCEQHLGIGIDRLDLDGVTDREEVLRRAAAAMTPATRVLSVSHVTHTVGLRLPIPELAELAHRHDALLVVDGAQAPGGLQVNLAELGCDAYATSAHKWLLAPPGTGLLYLAAAARDRIAPLPLAGGPRVYTGAVGLRNLPAMIGLGASIDFLNRLGPAHVERHNLDLRAALLAALRGLDLLSPADPAMGAPLVSLQLPAGTDAARLAARLRDAHGIVVKVLRHGPLNGLRISLHAYNRLEDVEAFAAALRHELG